MSGPMKLWFWAICNRQVVVLKQGCLFSEQIEK